MLLRDQLPQTALGLALAVLERIQKRLLLLLLLLQLRQQALYILE